MTRVPVRAVGIALACVVVATAGCGAAPPSETGTAPEALPTTRPASKMPAGSARFTDADSGRTADLTIGGTLIIDLEENPSTGFSWRVEGDIPDALKASGDQVKPSTDTSAIGAAGRRILTYKAVTAGEGDLKLVYVRSWEEDAAPEKTFEVHVAVR